MGIQQKVVLAAGTGAIVIAGALVATFEGYRPSAYRDPIGIPTICFGHTAGVRLGQSRTRTECEALLHADLVEAQATVERCVSVPLTENQRAAFISFAYNVGPGRTGVKDGFCVLKNGRQPSFLRRLNAGDYAAACEGLLAWTGAQGAGGPLRGLVRRRRDERDLCLM